MKLHAAIVFLGVLRTCAVETDGEPEQRHILTKRQTPEQTGHGSYTSHDDSAGTVSYVGSDSAASRDYQGTYPSYGGQNQPVEDLIASAHLTGSSSAQQARTSSSNSTSSSGGGGSRGRYYYRSTSGSNSTSSGTRGGTRGRSYYHYQPPISTGERTQSRRTGTSRYRHSRPVESSARASHGNTYIYPFSGGRERLRGTGSGHRYRPQGSSSRSPYGSTYRSSSYRSAAGSSHEPSSGSSFGSPYGSSGGPTGSAYGASSGTSGSISRSVYGTSSGSSSRSSSGSSSGSSSSSESSPGSGYPTSASVLTSGGQAGGDSVSGHEEPVVQVLPSERPVVHTRQQHQELLRQRRLERQRLIQERQQQQQQRQHQRQPQGGYVPTGQHRTIGQIYTDGSRQTGSGTDQYPYYTSGQQPVHSSGRQSVPRGSHGFQNPYNSYGYNQAGFDTTGYDSECPDTGIRIQINGIPCDQAVDHYGTYLCYRHEYTSRECCLKCRGLKNPAKVGCEYGDHSGRCQQLQSYDCYDLRNRQGCCQSCERMQLPGARPGCEYGDMTPNCERVRQNPGLCYIPENRYLCCQTCSNIRVTEDPDCPWGDQNEELCQPFDQVGNIRINCYAPPIKRICCQACQRLKEWIRIPEPGCEYGDRPVTFNTGTHRGLNCTSFMRYFGYEQCAQNQAVGTNCCYTCHRYTSG